MTSFDATSSRTDAVPHPGMLTNALSHLQNLQEIEVTAGYDNLTTLLRLVQSAAARVQCLAIECVYVLRV